MPTTCFILHFPVSPQGLIYHVHRRFVCLFLMDLQTNVSKRAVCKRAFAVVPDSSLKSMHENPSLLDKELLIYKGNKELLPLVVDNQVSWNNGPGGVQRDPEGKLMCCV